MSSQKLGHTQTGYLRVAGHRSSSFAEGSPGRSAWAIQASAPASNRSLCNDPLVCTQQVLSQLPQTPHIPTAGSGRVCTSAKPEVYAGQKYNPPHVSLAPLFAVSD